jgi:16S rRNA U516 pseudouridylate synthase RsuA-like enzyme
MPELMRIQRALARAGVASRRGAEELVAAGRVKINGQVAKTGRASIPKATRSQSTGNHSRRRLDSSG